MDTMLHVSLHESGSDPHRLDQLTRQLRDELRQLDVQEVRATAASDVPAGARGLDPATISTLAVLLGSGGLTAVITAARAWLDRGHEAPRSIRLELDGDVLELSGASPQEHDQLVAAFLGRRGGKGPTWTAGAQP